MPEPNGPFVTVVVPFYNSERHIAEALGSVTRQRGVTLEVVAVDDGSSDASRERADAVSDPRIRIISITNGGVARARNIGFAARDPASRFVLFLDADDRIDQDMLQHAVSFLQAHADAAFVSMGVRLIDDDGAPLPADLPWPPRLLPRRIGARPLASSETVTPLASLLTGTMSIPSNTVLRTAAVEAAGGFDEGFGQPFEDMDMFLRAALWGEAHALEHVRCVDYRRHAAQNTSDRERFREQERRLALRWSTASGLSGESAAWVRAAWRDRDTRLLPYLAWREGARLLRAGDVVLGLRILGGSVRARLRVIGRVRASRKGPVPPELPLAPTQGSSGTLPEPSPPSL